MLSVHPRGKAATLIAIPVLWMNVWWYLHTAVPFLNTHLGSVKEHAAAWKKKFHSCTFAQFQAAPLKPVRPKMTCRCKTKLCSVYIRVSCYVWPHFVLLVFSYIVFFFFLKKQYRKFSVWGNTWAKYRKSNPCVPWGLETVNQSTLPTFE